MFGIFVFLTHADPKGRNITYLLLPIRVPKVGPLRGFGLGVVTVIGSVKVMECCFGLRCEVNRDTMVPRDKM